MFIQTEETPNPATLKFLPGQAVMEKGVADFKSSADATISPLARGLFALDGVAGVFLGADFITITKTPSKEWNALKPHALAAIMDHYLSGLPTITQQAAPTQEAASDLDNAIVKQIKELIELRVRPAVAQDGGDITFNRFDEGVLYLNLKGSCAGCPSSTATLKAGIENMMRHYIPEVKEVRQEMG